jgi:hypothetical protein
MGKGWHMHRDGGTDPTELLKSARLVICHPTGACNTGLHHPTQPDMYSDLTGYEVAQEGA